MATEFELASALIAAENAKQDAEYWEGAYTRIQGKLVKAQADRDKYRKIAEEALQLASATTQAYANYIEQTKNFNQKMRKRLDRVL